MRSFVRRAVLPALLAAALPGAARAQWTPRYQVDVSLDYVGSTSMYGIALDGVSSAAEMAQYEKIRPSVAVTRLLPLPAPHASLRVGLALADKGYEERISVSGASGTASSRRDISLIYLGVPVMLGFNAANGHPGLKPVAEAGMTVDVLARHERSAYRNFDLKPVAASWVAGLGVKYNFRGGRSLSLGPELRIAAMNYARPARTFADAGIWRPVVEALKLTFQP